MTEYVTKADVDSLLGAGWEGTGDADRAVLEANAWLTARHVVASDPVEADILQAGAYLAEYAAQGSLYADDKGAVKRKMVKAGSVETETEYQDTARSLAGVIALVRDLLQPYTTAFTTTRILRRL